MKHSLYLYITLAALLFSACSRQGEDDLQAFVDEVKNQPAEPPPALPEHEPDEIHVYRADGRPDPFKTFVTPDAQPTVLPEPVNHPDCLKPKGRRPAEALESYPLDALRLVGMLEQKGQRLGLVQDPTGVVHRVTYGSYMGQNNGRVIAVTESGLELSEVVDGAGCFVERQAALALQQSPPEAGHGERSKTTKYVF